MPFPSAELDTSRGGSVDHTADRHRIGQYGVHDLAESKERSAVSDRFEHVGLGVVFKAVGQPW
jgi:hypothetical protein